MTRKELPLPLILSPPPQQQQQQQQQQQKQPRSTTIGQSIASYFLGETLSHADSALSNISSAAVAGQKTAAEAERTAVKIREILENPGGGLSGQPVISRGDYTQKLVSFYYNIFNHNPNDAHHILVIYDRSQRLSCFRRVLNSNGQYLQGPVEESFTLHKKIRRGKLMAGLWGFHLVVFKEGWIELLGDGGFQNWCFQSPSFTRDGKKVAFHRLD